MASPSDSQFGMTFRGPANLPMRQAITSGLGCMCQVISFFTVSKFCSTEFKHYADPEAAAYFEWQTHLVLKNGERLAVLVGFSPPFKVDTDVPLDSMVGRAYVLAAAIRHSLARYANGVPTPGPIAVVATLYRAEEAAAFDNPSAGFVTEQVVMLSPAPTYYVKLKNSLSAFDATVDSA